MVKDLNTNNAPFSLIVGIQTTAPTQIQFDAIDKSKWFEAKDKSKHYTWYERMQGTVNGYKEFVLSFPITPEVLTLGIYNANGQNANQNEGFKIVKLQVEAVKTKNIALSAEDNEYLKFLYEFAKNKNIYSADTTWNGKKVPSIYGSNGRKFKFLYYNNLIDSKTGQELNTPTFVGNDTGDVSWSKSKLLSYTVPMVVMLGLHERGHTTNPASGLAIGNEMGADVTGLNIFRSRGFNKEPAEYVMGAVFAGNNTSENQKRLQVIKKFNIDFDSGALDKFYSEVPIQKKWKP